MKRRARTVAALMLGLAFVTGGMAGMVIEEALGLDWFDFLDSDYRPLEEQLLSGLDLSADQSDRIDAILQRQHARLEEYWRVRVPEMERIIVESYDDIREALTPEQRAVFDRRVEAQGIQVPLSPD